MDLDAFSYICSLREEAGVKFSSSLLTILGNILQFFHRPEVVGLAFVTGSGKGLEAAETGFSRFLLRSWMQAKYL